MKINKSKKVNVGFGMKIPVSLVSIILIVALIALVCGYFWITFNSGRQNAGLKDQPAKIIKVPEESELEIFSGEGLELKVLVVPNEGEYSTQENWPLSSDDWFESQFPEVKIEEVDIASDKGIFMVDKYNVSRIPSFIFSENVKETKFYQKKEHQKFFKDKKDAVFFNSSVFGLHPDSFLKAPDVFEDDYLIGDREAKVKVVMFVSFQCPISRDLYRDAIGAIKDIDEKNIALIVKDLPLESQAQSRNASLAVRCAQEQGAFEEMAVLIFDTQEDWSTKIGKESFESLGKEIVLENYNQYVECLREDRFSNLIQRGVDESEELQLSGVPNLFVNDQYISGAYSKVELRMKINKELKK